MTGKVFKLSPDQIDPLALQRGCCVASDMITVQGMSVGYMYRETPDFKDDSGWRFLAGTESQEYLENPENLQIYDVNTIANYDSEIIPFLDEISGSAFERCQSTGGFVATDFPCEP
ncbi:DUF2185 domain-containing protein [Schlesneria paludicola]|uniref:DUF2185 domain-containing protein n=1 Tax=Schlesneria paludicola TaxID=360056 RepID=UPI00029B04C3|nr:DUF2185 domain-containing protein [Schlesneria paludicola]